MSTLEEKHSQVSNFYAILRDTFQEIYSFENCQVFKNTLINFMRLLQDFKAGEIDADILRKSKDEVYQNCLKAIEELRPINSQYYMTKMISMNEIYDIVMCGYYTTVNEYKKINCKICNHTTNTSVEILTHLNDVSGKSSEKQYTSEELKVMSEERTEILKQLSSTTKQLGNVFEQLILSNMAKEKNHLSEQLKKMSKECSDIIDQPKSISKENTFEFVIIKELEDVTPVQTTSIATDYSCTAEMTVDLTNAEPSQGSNETEIDNIPANISTNMECTELQEKYKDTEKPKPSEIDAVGSADIYVSHIVPNLAYYIFTEWKSSYPATKLETFFISHLHNINSNLFLECANELYGGQTFTAAECSAIDNKWSQIFTGALKQWQCQSTICK